MIWLIWCWSWCFHNVMLNHDEETKQTKVHEGLHLFCLTVSVFLWLFGLMQWSYDRIQKKIIILDYITAFYRDQTM